MTETKTEITPLEDRFEVELGEITLHLKLMHMEPARADALRAEIETLKPRAISPTDARMLGKRVEDVDEFAADLASRVEEHERSLETGETAAPMSGRLIRLRADEERRVRRSLATYTYEAAVLRLFLDEHEREEKERERLRYARRGTTIRGPEEES